MAWLAGSRLDLGVLVLRVGLGLMMVVAHGWPKLIGGPDKWAALGGSMAVVGIEFAPTMWGFLAAFTETFGGIALALGLLTRLSAAGLAFTMLIAALVQFDSGGGLFGASHAMEDGVAFVALLVAGGGRYSLDHWIAARRGR